MQYTQQKLSRLIYEQARVFAALERRFRSALPVTVSQSYVIEAIAKYEQISVQGLSEYIGTTISTTSRNLDKLAARGLVKKEPDPDDARKTILSLTDSGLLIAAKIEQTRQEYFAKIFEHIPESRLPELIESAKKILSSVEKTYLRSKKRI